MTPFTAAQKRVDAMTPSEYNVTDGQKDVVTLQHFEDEIRQEIQALLDRQVTDGERSGSDGGEMLTFPPMSKEQRYLVYVRTYSSSPALSFSI